MALIKVRLVNGKYVKDPVIAAQKVKQLPDPKAKASDWRVWLQTANDLRKAANVLKSQEYYPSTTLGPAYLLLIGYSLENLVKALLTKNGLQTWRADDTLSWGVKNGHNLPALFRKTGLTLQDWEEEFLSRVKRFVEWAGRYPIPKDLKRALEMNQSAMSRIDPSKFESLFHRLAKELAK